MLKRMLAPAVPVLALLLAAACSDGPTGPARARLGAVEPMAGDGQTAGVGEAVAVAPAVLVTDTRGRALAGISVSFVVTRGGGTLARERSVSDADGIAGAGTWVLGSEGANEVEARVAALTPVRFMAEAVAAPSVSVAPPSPPLPPSAPPAVSAGGYQVAVRYVASVNARQQQSVAAALARWQSIIVSDAADVPMDVASGTCFPTQPRLQEVVDDLLLYVEFVAIDGPGGTLGESGPCFVRTESGLPIIGYVKLDVADLQRMDQAGTLDDVVLHEIGHVLGIGTLWERGGLVKGAGGTDPRYTGAGAVAAYGGLGGSAADVAVENTGGSGTRDGHWRESEFGNELMTGYISGFPNPLSALTVASLQDLGYGASQARAGTYVLGGSSFHSTAAVDLRGRERLHKPKYRVDRMGRKQRLER